jgi:uncharacterized coiled-coil DUF342 family protein
MGSPDQIPDVLERIAQDMMAGFQLYFSSRRDKSMESARLFRDLHACFKNIHDLVQKNEESRRRSDELHVYANLLANIISAEMVPNIDKIVKNLSEIEGVEMLNKTLNNSSDKNAKLEKIEYAAQAFDKMANMFEKGFKF